MDLAEFKSLVLKGETDKVEFKSAYPKNAHNLAKEIAALASTDGGYVLLGIADDKSIVGLPGIVSALARRALIERIEALCAQSISPAVSVVVKFVAVERGDVAVIIVPSKRGEIYYASGRPYIRSMSICRVATPQEVKHRILLDDVLRRLEELESKPGSQSGVAVAIMGQGELATMNRSDILRIIEKRKSRQFP